TPRGSPRSWGWSGRPRLPAPPRPAGPRRPRPATTCWGTGRGRARPRPRPRRRRGLGTSVACSFSGSCDESGRGFGRSFRADDVVLELARAVGLGPQPDAALHGRLQNGVVGGELV